MKTLTPFHLGEFELPRTLAQFLDLPRFMEGEAILKWSPTVDVTEDEKSYQVKAELPEVAKENIKVTTENGILTIAGERKSEKEEKNKRYHRREIVYGTFSRSFGIPEDADENGVIADYKDGILKVTLPKVEKPKPKKSKLKSTKRAWGDASPPIANKLRLNTNQRMARRDDYTLLCERHRPVQNHIDPNAAYDGCMFETYGADYEYIQSLPPERVFTLLGTDKLYASPGKHWVNRMGYFVVEIPWNAKNEGRTYFVG